MCERSEALKLDHKGRVGMSGGDPVLAASFVTLWLGFYSFWQESMAFRKHSTLVGSCKLRRGVIGGEARGPWWGSGGMAGLVTSRFRVCTDLIELATTFLHFFSFAKRYMLR